MIKEITQKQAEEFIANTKVYGNGRGIQGWELEGTGTSAILSFPWYHTKDSALDSLVSKFLPSTLPPFKQLNGWYCSSCLRAYEGGPKVETEYRLERPSCPDCGCTMSKLR